MPSKSPSQARLMAASAHSAGGYGGVPQSVGKEFVAAEKVAAHPRQHSLAMASADTLHKAGYISGAHKDAIRAHAGKKLAAHKASKPAAYGSLAPQSAGHYLSTVNPGAAQDEESGM